MKGRVWTWTVQRFQPKSPPYVPTSDQFEPFAVGYIELPEGVRIEGIIEAEPVDSVYIGMPVRLMEASGVPRYAPTPRTFA